MKKIQIGRLVIEMSLEFRIAPKHRLGDFGVCPHCKSNRVFWFVPGYQIGRAHNPPLKNWILVDSIDSEGNGQHVCPGPIDPKLQS